MGKLILPFTVLDFTMGKVRACPICPQCGSKKFDRIKAKETIVKCAKCGNKMIV